MKDTDQTKENKEVLQMMNKNEEKLRATMTECFLFQTSFKLGARMMLEVMED